MHKHTSWPYLAPFVNNFSCGILLNPAGSACIVTKY